MSINSLSLFTLDNKFDTNTTQPIMIIAELKDGNGTPIQGKSILWKCKGCNPKQVNAGPVSNITDNNGRVSYKITSNIAAGLIITATEADDHSVTSNINVGFANSSLRPPSALLQDEPSQGIECIIEVNRHVDPPNKGDIYRIYWDTHQVDMIMDMGGDLNKDFPIVTSIDNEKGYLSIGTHYVYYTITDSQNNISYSPVVPVCIGRNNKKPTYDKPIFPDLQYALLNNQTLNADDGLIIKIPYPQSDSNAKIEPGDKISVYMSRDSNEPYFNGTDIADYTVSKFDISSKNISFKASKYFFIDNSNDTFNNVIIYISYVVKGDDTAYSYKAALQVDTKSPGNYILREVLI